MSSSPSRIPEADWLATPASVRTLQGRDVWQLLEQAWIAHHRGGVMPSLLPDP
jgi:hypothetical protein